MKTFLFITLCVLIFSGLPAEPASLPDTIWLPVTFYDFHSDGSNPEFECDHMERLRNGMVAETLDSEGKPTLGPTPYINYFIKYWFRDWNGLGGGKGDFTRPHYTRTGGGSSQFTATIMYDSIEHVNHDTSFKNVVIKDSLPFLLTDKTTGLYTYNRTDTSATGGFFPLDGKGFGDDLHEINPPHNYSFTMEFHHEFTYQGDEVFRFSGDDDMWIFINKKLALDLGGIHQQITDSIKISDLAPKLNLMVNHSYMLDIFYAERHSTTSNCLLTTNLVRPFIDTFPVSSKQILNKPERNLFITNRKLNYSLSSPSFVSISLYDIQGRLVNTLFDQMQSPGGHSVTFPSYLDCGNYIVRFTAGNLKWERPLFIGR